MKSSWMFIILIAAYARADVSDLCDADTDCSDSVRNSRCGHVFSDCEKGVCVCDDGYYVATSTTCRLVAHLGDACDLDADCIHGTVNSVCNTDGECECSGGVDMPDRLVDGIRYCYETLIDVTCAVDADCLSFQVDNSAGICDVDTDPDQCGCDDSFTQNGETCVEVSRGDSCREQPTDDPMSCTANTECVTDGATSTCECPINTTWKSGYGLCIHDDASVDIDVGADCDVNSYINSDGKICFSELVCARCPGVSTGTTTCQKPAKSASMTIRATVCLWIALVTSLIINASL